jgi:hypothetical protein
MRRGVVSIRTADHPRNKNTRKRQLFYFISVYYDCYYRIDFKGSGDYIVSMYFGPRGINSQATIV